ncbi:Hypothetical protein TPAR_09713 [Tolypocladium paradoxum]|uniref:Uncharacterized protein n=1 Tax=Tolypocladium paradoxum TaxID=94208 RepID=A0A2S4KXK2_9HYPO|nr:Hypothetical protein TPAR_09713 [Tolypocladium paradoxum]
MADIAGLGQGTNRRGLRRTGHHLPLPRRLGLSHLQARYSRPAPRRGHVEHQIQRQRLEFVSDILIIGNDMQMVLGGSYMIAAFASAKTIDLHPRRLVFLGARRVLVSAFLQLPAYLHMAVALRSANQGRLEGEETDENGWDFGRTTAVVLLAVAVEELFTKGWEYLSSSTSYERRDARKEGGAVEGRGGAARDYELQDEQRRLTGESRKQAPYCWTRRRTPNRPVPFYPDTPTLAKVDSRFVLLGIAMPKPSFIHEPILPQ